MTNRKLLVAASAAAAIFAAACNSDRLTSVNNNPNSPTDAPSGALFVNAARNGVGRWLDGVGGTRYAFLSQHLAEVQYPDADAYVRLLAPTTSAPLFDRSYSVELYDFQVLIRRGRAANQPGLWGPALVMKSWEFGILTDVFGDVPYTQAFLADSGILQPRFDTQQSIYTDLFARLTEAATALSASPANVLGGSDPIYDGSPTAWARFANSLRLRHALRISYADQAQANTQLAAALAAAAGVIETNAQNAKLAWPGDGIYDNPWANNFKTRDDHRISTRLLTYLRDFNDPRLPVYAMRADDDMAEDPTRMLKYCPDATVPCYVGLENALDQDAASPLVAFTSRPGAVFYPGVTSYGTFGGTGGSFPSFLMTAAEVDFIRAEAAERGLGGLNPAQAQGFYNSAVTKSMEMWGISGVAVTTYLAQPAVAYNGATLADSGLTLQARRLKRVAIQKWLALLTDPIQAWIEFRRTCQPAILHPGPEAIEDEIPRRLQYSTTDAAVNAANYRAAVARQGDDDLITRVWWDKASDNAITFEAGCGQR